VPPDRWDIDAYYDPDPDAPGKMSTRCGGFLEGIDEFDPQFFGIAPREAVSLDPQQRLLLEVAWEALENANIPADRLYGSATGVFIGIISQDYSHRLLSLSSLDRIDAYSGTGASMGMAAGRLSYCLGLTGPSLSVDTACSSSLVTLHLACESLRRKECSLALTGGVNAILEPGLSVNFSKARMLAPDGRCKTFDEAADGYVRGEGCGVLVLKRLSDAQQDGDRILAVVRGSAVNQDGPSGGLTVPSGPSQERVMRQALANARVAPDAVSYVEAHGTGTALGDPIELGALDRVFGTTHSRTNPLHIGSVKTNIGHLEAAAGVAGVIKLVLSLQHGCLPPHLHCQHLTSRFPWTEKPLHVVTERLSWPRSDTPRIAGVSSFGFSGTNAHIVIEEAPPADAGASNADEPPHLLVLSARSKEALSALAGRYRDQLHDQPQVTLPDLCRAAAMGRAHLPHRTSVIATSVADAAERLDALAQGKRPPRPASGNMGASTLPPVAFLFTGQGSQYPGMGRRLYRTQKVFRDAVNRCDEILRPLSDVNLTDLLFGAEAGRLDMTGYTQPALFCLEFALSEWWQSLGVRPDAVLGHSVGEYVAACVAGVFSLEDGIKLIAARARLMQALPPGGAMAAVFAPEAEVLRALQGRRDHLSIAALNGPAHVVVSGDNARLAQVLAELREAGTRYRELNVSHAFHSPLMEPMLAEFARVAETVSFREPTLPLSSNVTGSIVRGEAAQPGYWVRHIRDAVRFVEGAAALRELGCQIFVEIGPDPILLGMIRQSGDNDALLVPSLRRENDAQFLHALSDLYAHGATIDWHALYQTQRHRTVPLPTYPFQRKRYWVDSPSQPRATSAPPLPTQEADPQALLRYFADSGELSTEEMKLLPKLVQLLTKQPAQATSAEERDTCFRLGWQEKARIAQSDEPRPGTWLLLASNGTAELTDALRTRGARCICADLADDGGFHRLIDEAGQAEGMVFLWPSAPASDTSSCRSAEAHLTQLARLVGELEQRKAPPRLWLVTQGAISAGGSVPVSPFPAALWGFGRTLFLEHPALRGGLIDLSAVPDPDEMPALVRDLLDPDGDDNIALRGGRRYVARIERAAPAHSGSAHLRAEGAYLITGGLGALGLHVARLLAEKGAGAVVLMSRRNVSDAAAGTLDALRKLGARVIVAQGDCTDEAAVRASIEQAAGAGFGLSGIVHAAGNMKPQAVAELDAASLHEVLSPKVDGAWVLHRLTQDVPLDFFVCFSSVAAILGMTQHAQYGAANAFLDGLAEYRRGLGLPALSVNWGPWQGRGLAEGDTARRIAGNGFNPMAPSTAVHLLGRLLDSGEPRMIVVDADWRRVRNLYEARGRQPMLELFESLAPVSEPASSAALDALRKSAPSDRLSFVIGFLQEQVGAVLLFDDATALDPRQGFFDMGLDSLTAVELKGQVEAQLAVSLPPSAVFDYPNIAVLADFLLRQIFDDAPSPNGADRVAPVSAGRPPDPLLPAELRHLSDTEIAALIDDELATLGGDA
jgi:acyl transferase domain-containing protein/acyl carrier protein